MQAAMQTREWSKSEPMMPREENEGRQPIRSYRARLSMTAIILYAIWFVKTSGLGKDLWDLRSL